MRLTLSLPFTALAETGDRAPVTHAQHTLQAVLFCVYHQTTAARHGAHQVVELALNGREVVKNIRVVKLQIVQHGGARAVMHKLAALIEKRGVVFIGLDDKQGPGLTCCQLPQTRGHAEIQRHAADQKTGRQTGLIQNPTQHGGGGGFAVRTGDCQHMPGLAGRV